jgi:hypothetical protein
MDTQEVELPEDLQAYWKARRPASVAAAAAMPVRTRPSLQTDDCPPLPRFVAAALDPRLWNAEEKQHMEGCPFCQKALAMSERKALHPRPLALLQWHLGRLTGQEAEVIEGHIQQDHCLKCERLMQSRWFQAAAAVARTGEAAWEQVQKKLEMTPVLLGVLPQRTAALSFANTAHAPFRWSGEWNEEGMRIRLIEEQKWTKDSEPGDLVAIVDAGAEHAGRGLHLEITGESMQDDPLECDFVLAAGDDGTSGARYNFGPFSSVADRLGSTPVLIARMEAV